MSIKHVVMFSGGAGSFAAARRVVIRCGRNNVTLLCADTRSESDDWRPFIVDAAAYLDTELIVLDQGLDIWELATKNRMIPNTRADFCSRILKREPLRKWVETHCDPESTVIHLGFGALEEHRLERARPHWAPWTIDAPLMWDPAIDSSQAIEYVRVAGLDMPHAYVAGMPHNNCLKYGCVKGGQAYWKRLLEEMPDSYQRAESEEERIRADLGKDVSILRDRTGGTTDPLTLRDFRLRITSQPTLFDPTDFGSCSCMTGPGQ